MSVGKLWGCGGLGSSEDITPTTPKCVLEHVNMNPAWPVQHWVHNSMSASAPRTTLATPECFLEHVKINSVWPVQQLALLEDQECAPRAALANAKRTSDHVRNCIPA